jgi:hypothetical protein
VGRVRRQQALPARGTSRYQNCHQDLGFALTP